MTELSPAAEAVLDAYENSYTESGLGDKDVLYMLNLTKKITPCTDFTPD
jgi:hypothetical protein